MRRQTQLEGFQLEGNSSAVVVWRRGDGCEPDLTRGASERPGPFLPDNLLGGVRSRVLLHSSRTSRPRRDAVLMDWSTTRPAIWVGRGVSQTLECLCELRFSHEVETAKYKHAPCFLSSRMTPSENLLSVQNAITKQYVWLQQFNILPPCPYVAVRERFYTHIRTNGFHPYIFAHFSFHLSVARNRM